MILTIGLFFITTLLFVNYLYSQSDRHNISQADIDSLQSREQIKSYVMQRAENDLQQLINLARTGGDIPEEFYFLVIQAGRIYWDRKQPNPERWDARATLSAFSSRSEIFTAIESKYREEIFSRLHLQMRRMQLILQADIVSFQERLGRALTAADRTDLMQRTLILLRDRLNRFAITAPVIQRQGDNQVYMEIIVNTYTLLDIDNIITGLGRPDFHILDEEATDVFNNFYKINPENTFNSSGELINHTIIPADVVIRGVYVKDNYGLDEQRWNSGMLDFVAIRREIGLTGYYIRSADINNNANDRPVITFILNSEGGEIFYKLTSVNVGKAMAIVFDDRVRFQATIITAIRDAVAIEGFGTEEANYITTMLKTPPFPAKLEVINKRLLEVTTVENMVR